MKIGIFDSGLGGLIIAKAIMKELPAYDYIYLGDTKNLPYGEKRPEKIYRYTQKAVDFLFANDCQLIIVACNTSSALALRKIQQQYLPKKYPDRRVLGVIIPTLESIFPSPIHGEGLRERLKIGVIGTKATISSHIYKKELQKINHKAKIYELATPDLVRLIEQNALPKAENRLKLYLKPLQKQGIEALILGCTHYPILKKAAKRILGPKVAIVSQDEIIPNKLANYLKRHSEISYQLTKNHQRQFFVTKMGKNFEAVAKRLLGKKTDFKLVNIDTFIQSCMNVSVIHAGLAHLARLR